jgi:hypothetical protein
MGRLSISEAPGLQEAKRVADRSLWSNLWKATLSKSGGWRKQGTPRNSATIGPTWSGMGKVGKVSGEGWEHCAHFGSWGPVPGRTRTL